MVTTISNSLSTVIGIVGSRRFREAGVHESPASSIQVEPERGQKWEKKPGSSGLVHDQVVITAVHDDHVSYRSMADNGSRSLTLDELRRDWRFIEDVEIGDW